MSVTSNSDDGFKPVYFDNIAAVEERSFWFRSRTQLILWALKKYFPGLKSFFEVGCGTGFVLSGIRSDFPTIELSGCDFFERGLEYARKRVPSARLFQEDARKLSFRNEYDVIGSFDVLEHIAEDEAVLTNMYLALKANGGVVLAVPQHQFLYNQYDEYCHHKRRYDRKELVDKVKRAGFSVQCVTSFVSILFPVMLLSRLLEKVSAAKTSSTNSMCLPRALDAVFGWIMKVECTLIKCGVRLPFGGSLLLIGYKNE